MNRRHFLRTAGAAGVTTSWIFSRGSEAALAGVSRQGDSASAAIRLGSNENALGISPAARRAIDNVLSEGNRYPMAVAEEFREELAQYHRAKPENVVLGCGSAEILQMAVQAQLGPDALLVTAHPTFEIVARYAEPLGPRVEKVPLTADYQHDLVRMRDLADRHAGPVLVYVCNPNNPTGTLTSCDDLEAWIEEADDRILFVVDEAYYHFVEAPRFRSLRETAVGRPNVVVPHTFSKVYALAGLRQGYAICHPETAARLNAFSTTVSCNQIGLAAASASLKDTGFLRRSLETNRESRRRLLEVLRELEIEWLESHANFVMFRLAGEIGPFQERMLERGIEVGRPFPPLLDHCRISLGLPEEMQRFADTLVEFRSKGWV